MDFVSVDKNTSHHIALATTDFRFPAYSYIANAEIQLEKWKQNNNRLQQDNRFHALFNSIISLALTPIGYIS